MVIGSLRLLLSIRRRAITGILLLAYIHFRAAGEACARAGPGNLQEKPRLEPKKRDPCAMRGRIGLRGRFAVALFLLAGLSAAPLIVAQSARAHLAGAASQLDIAGSLRRRLAQLGLEMQRGPLDDAGRERVERMLAAQGTALRALTEGDPTLHTPTCTSGPACAVFSEHRAHWEAAVAPEVRRALDEPGRRPALSALLADELDEVDRAVHDVAEIYEADVRGLVRLGVIAAAATLLCVLLAAYGVWEVFTRIRRLRDAAGAPDAEERVAALSTGTDELASLGRALHSGLEARREAREREARRAEDLATQRRAVGELVEALNAWIAGAGTLDAGLAVAAAAAGYEDAWVEGRSATGQRTPLAALHSDRAPADGASAVVQELHWSEVHIGTLTLAGPASPAAARDAAPLVEICARVISLALMARGLLEALEQRSRIAELLATLPVLEDGLADLGGLLRRGVGHDVAFLGLSDGVRAGQTWRIAPDGVAPTSHALEVPALGEPAPLPPEAIAGSPLLRGERATAAMGVPLRVGGRPVAALVLARAAAFTPGEIDGARHVAPVIASAIARMELEARLRASENMGVLSGLARLLAHEVRNPLNSLSLQVTLLDRGLHRLAPPGPLLEPLAEHVQVLRVEVARLDRIVREFLQLAPSPADARLERDDLRTLLAEVVELHRPRLEELGVSAELDLGAGPAIATFDRSRLHQVVHNLVQNAIEAMAASAVKRLGVSLRAQKSAWEIRVCDTGPGLEEPTRVFAPATSSKPTGYGLGLAVSQHIARLHGGTLIARPADGGGAELVLTLPALGRSS